MPYETREPEEIGQPCSPQAHSAAGMGAVMMG